MAISARTLDLIGPLARGETANVPCNGCTACCRNEFKLLLPEQGDRVETYEHVYIDTANIGRRPMLANKPNGECVYLTETGCSIHDRAPRICRSFDCRKFFRHFSRTERRQMVKNGTAKPAVLDAGRERAATLAP